MSNVVICKKLKQASPIAYWLLYPGLWVAHALLSPEVRNFLARKVLRVVGCKAEFYRKVTAWSLNKEQRPVSITISLTSYPARIKSISYTIETLLNQDLKADRVVLWLGEDKFLRGEKDLPADLLRLKKFGLTIGWCKDIRSYTKLIPSLKAYPNDIIVTADDDSLYRPDWLRRLYDSYLTMPEAVHSQRVLQMKLDEKGRPTSYNNWQYGKEIGSASFANLLLGFSGVLYPPRCFDEEVFNREVFTAIAPTTDDLWFWAMAVYSGRKICLASGGDAHDANLFASGENALWNVNASTSNGNDPQLVVILTRYEIVRARLLQSASGRRCLIC